MPNHLGNENSPYLLQHANNPVDWYAWGQLALAKARNENKPIFLSIGYAACHWCHVMERESFEDPQIAAILNENFVSIKVDREQRPDLDSLYMQATTALTGSGGWPMSVFLTPDLQPFYAGTYFPPVRRHGLPAFRDVLVSLVSTWREQPDQITTAARQIAAQLRGTGHPVPSGVFTEAALDSADDALQRAYDWEYGGWGAAPKFPQPMSIDYLLRRAVSDGASHPERLRAALHALRSMARGGMFDVVGGGFARYSTDAEWRVPHFEKMLYDNAQLVLAYLHAWQITGDSLYERVAIETLDFVLREMTGPGGGFYSSLDADSEGEEGKFYVWTRQEIREVLTADSAFDFFAVAYGITDRGNWEGRTVLQRALDDASLASRFGLQAEPVNGLLADAHRSLLHARDRRPRPTTDDKVVLAWNGLMLQAFAEAGRVLDDSSKRALYLSAAIRNAEFLLAELRPSGKLHRTWRAGKTSAAVFLEDFACLALGLLALYQSDFDVRWYRAAQQLAAEMTDRYADPAGGFFDTPRDGETLWMRPKEIQDHATPSGNAVAAQALLELSNLSDQSQYRDLAEQTLGLVGELAPKHPTSFARWLAAADYALNGNQQVAVLYSQPQGAQPLLDVVHEKFRPHLIVAASSFPPHGDAPALLANRPLVDGRPTAYVCKNFACKLPVTAPEELRQQL